MVYRTIAPLQDLVKNWEIWNEPWIHSWTWNTGTAQDYRDMTRLIWNRVKPEFPDVNIIGGGSTTFNRDIVYAKGSPDTGYIDGSVNHAYGPPDPAQLAAIKVQRQMDRRWSKTKGRAGMWQTELGTGDFCFGHLPEAQRKYAVARTVAPTYLLHLLAAGDTPIHIFWFALSFGSGFSGGEFNVYDATTRSPKPAVVAYSAMTHFLEDAKLVGEVFPRSKAVWGFLFERPDGRGTAAIYADKEYSGTLQLPSAAGLAAYDHLGRRIGGGGGGPQTIVLKPLEVVYLVSELPVQAFGAQLRHARFDLSPSVIVSPLSFTKPPGQDSHIDVLVENATPKSVDGVVKITAPAGWVLASGERSLHHLMPGEKRTVRFPVASFQANPVNRYLVGYEARITGASQPVVGEQTIQVAAAPFRSVTVDGDLSDWQEVVPVTMVASGSRDYAALARDPALVQAALESNSLDNPVYRLKTAWDLESFYFMAEVPDASHAGNKTFSEDPYAFSFWADSLQLLFDDTFPFNPDDLLVGDPHYEKALATDMDYHFIATLARGDVPELYRQSARGTNYQTFYPTNAPLDPPLAPIDVTSPNGEGKLVARREGTRTVYEGAIAWKSMPFVFWWKLVWLASGLPCDGTSIPFAFAVNDTGPQGKGTSYWTKEAGPLQSGSYAFAPFWGTGQKSAGGRITTRWGFTLH